MTEPFWMRVDDLTKPRHVKLLRDDGPADWTTLPSLWWQLTEAAQYRTANDGGSNGVPRTPGDIDCLELLLTIRDVVDDAIRGHDQRPRDTVPDSLRALASIVTALRDDDLTGWWTYRVGSWCRQVEHALRLDDAPQPRRIRDTRCPACGESHVTIVTPEGRQHVPALLIDFADRMVRAASCTACGSTWFRGQALLDLADEIATHRPAADRRSPITGLLMPPDCGYEVG